VLHQILVIRKASSPHSFEAIVPRPEHDYQLDTGGKRRSPISTDCVDVRGGDAYPRLLEERERARETAPEELRAKIRGAEQADPQD
jgi:hypothetical protein